MEEKKKKFNYIERFKDPSFKIARKGKWYAIAPALVIIAGFIVMLVVNFNLGLDFTGGRRISIRIEDEAQYAQFRPEIQAVFNEFRNEHGSSFSITRIEVDNIYIEVEFQNVSGMNDEEMEELTTTIMESIRDRIHAGHAVTAHVDLIGVTSARASGDFIVNTLIAATAILVMILIYMFFRFKFTSGMAAIIGLFHDILVMMALVAIFQIQLNSAIIAAIATVLVYSLNNTLVVFDRIRSAEKDNTAGLSTEEIVDKCVKETFTRTMNTTITTLVPLFVLIILGVPAIREFTVPILFGLIAGTFSTIFVTTSLYVRFENAKQAAVRRKKKKLAGRVA